MIREFRQNFIGVLVALAVLSFAIYCLATLRLPSVAAHSSTEASATKAPAPSKELHEANHFLQAAVYTTTGGWSSSLLLLNAEGKAVTARVTLYNRKGRSLNIAPITLEAYKSRSWNVADWIGDTEGFEEGSLTVSYNGLSMGLHAQETVTNRERSLSFDVHLEDAMEFMSSMVDGLWWELDDRSEAKVFISNTKATETTVTPIFYVAGLAHQDKPIVLKAHASDDIDIGKELKELHLSSASGGISFSYTNGPGALSVVGVISNNQSRFSTTMRFVDHMMGSTTSLHGANIMIGRSAANPGFPSTARFTPHVILRNTTTQIVQATARIRFTLFDQPNVTELPPATLAANEVRELDMSPAINAIGDSAVQDAGIEMDYIGQPGALMAYATSVDQTGGSAFDVPIKDPKGMMFKGGANPWKIDGNNRAVLHVKNVNIPDGQKHDFTVTLYYDGGVYNLPVQSVEAGQTAEIDIRKLRDDQVKDSSDNVIPLNISRGQLSWYPRAKKGDFIGRLVQYDPVAGISSSFSCDEPCWCGPDYGTSWLSPNSYQGARGDIFQVRAFEVDIDCHGWPHGPYQVGANFYTIDPSVAFVIYPNYVYLTDGGSTTVIGVWDSYYTAGEDCNQWDWASGWCEQPVCDYQSIPAGGATAVLVAPRITSITPAQGLVGNTIAVSIDGHGFGVFPSVSAGDGITATVNFANSTSFHIDASFAISANASGGNHSVTVTVGGQSSNSVTFFVQIPTSLGRFNFPPGAPDGYGPLTLTASTNDEDRDVNGNAILTNQCGVYRNLVYELKDQQGQPITQGFDIRETFSNYTGFSTLPGDISAHSSQGLVQDNQYVGKTLPNCLAANNNESFDQQFVVTIGGRTFSLTTVVHIARGRFSGDYAVDITTTTP
jgi:hypothetical protein